MMKKRFLSLIFAVLLTLSAVIPAFAAVGTVNDEGLEGRPFVVDSLDVLTDEEEAECEKLLRELSEKYQMDFVFLSVAKAGDSDYRRMCFADDFYDYKGYRVDGVLFMYEEYSTYKYISTAGKCITALKDSTINNMLDEIDVETDMRDFADAVEIFAAYCERYCGHYAETGKVYRDYPFSIFLIFSLAFALILALICFANEKAKLKSVSPKQSAEDYTVKDSLHVTGGRDIYLYSSVTKSPRQTSNSSGGGSRSHSSSSGRSHGGGGRH